MVPEEPFPDFTNIVILGSRTLRYGGLDSSGVSVGPYTLPHVLSQDRSLVGNAALQGTAEVRYGNELDGVAQLVDSDNLKAILSALKQTENPLQWSEGPTLFGLNKSCGFDHLKTLCEIFFETESGHKLDIRSNQELALYAHAKDVEGVKSIQTGISLDVGDVTTTASAFVHGSLVSERVLRLGGRDVTNYLRELLNNGSLNQEPRSQEILYKLKEEHCYVATPNFEAASQRRDKDSSLAVDAGFGSYGQRVNFAVERFTCPEILFKPHMIGRDCGGIQYLISDLLFDCAIDSRKDLLANLFLSGGCTLFKGFAERLQFELKFLHEDVFSSSRVKVHELGINAAYDGAVTFAKVSREKPEASSYYSVSSAHWMDNNDWYESADVAVRKKFFRPTAAEHPHYWSGGINY